MHALLDFASHRVDSGQVAFKAFGGLAEAAVPASFPVVFLSVDRHVYAGRQGRNVEELGVGVVGRWPVIVTAGLGRAKLLERLSGVQVANPRIGLDVLAGVVVDRLAGLLVDALGPVDIVHIGLGADWRR